MINQLFKNKKILVIAAHPDDEILGLGATLHRFIKRHDCQSRAVILGEGITSRGKKEEAAKWKTDLEIHRNNIARAAEFIGYEGTGIYDLPDNRFDSVDLLDIIKLVESEISSFKPDIIFTHHAYDLNIDHRLTLEAVMTAARPLPEKKPMMLLAFETPSSTEWQIAEPHTAFLPNLFIPVTLQDLEAKKNAMAAYTSECREYPHPRSLKALEIIARRWGTVVGSEYAEAFRIIRFVAQEG